MIRNPNGDRWYTVEEIQIGQRNPPEINDINCPRCGHSIHQHTSVALTIEDYTKYLARCDVDRCVHKCMVDPYDLFNIPGYNMPNIDTNQNEIEITGGGTFYTEADGNLFEVPRPNREFRINPNQIVPDDQVVDILTQLFNILEERGFIASINKTSTVDEILRFDHIIFRIGESSQLLKKILRATRNGDMDTIIRNQVFDVDDVNLLTSNMILHSLLEQYEFIPKIFKRLSTARFLKWYDRRRFDGNNDFDFELNKLFHKFTCDLNCNECNMLFNGRIRNVIAHNSYWWNNDRHAPLLVFIDGNNKFEIDIPELENAFIRVRLVTQTIIEICKNRDYWYKINNR